MNKFWILYYLSIFASLILIGSLGQYIFGSGYGGTTNYGTVILGFGAIVIIASLAIYLRYKAVRQDEAARISIESINSKQPK